MTWSRRDKGGRRRTMGREGGGGKSDGGGRRKRMGKGGKENELQLKFQLR